MIGCSSRFVSKLFDKNDDLAYRLGLDRRVTYDNLMIILQREGITPLHLNLNQSKQMVWIGEPVKDYESQEDCRASVVKALYMLSKNEVGAVACINHSIGVDDLITLAKAASSKFVKIAARLPDDAANCARKTDYSWLYHPDKSGSMLEIMCWLRDVELGTDAEG